MLHSGVFVLSPRLHAPNGGAPSGAPPSLPRVSPPGLKRFLPPPLFPVRLRDLPSRLALHDVPLGGFDVGGQHVASALVTHPGPTVGHRTRVNGRSLAYIPDHEPALGETRVARPSDWPPGYAAAHGAGL